LGRSSLLLATAILLAAAAPVGAVDSSELGGDFRLYSFLFLEDLPIDRQDVELALLRIKLRSYLSDALSFEAHALVELSSPGALAQATSIVSGETRRYFDLEWEFLDHRDVRGVASFDRLNVRWEHPSFRVVAGRQAITWGVNYFWPVLDLFAPFAPERVDRDYKPGVDAVRLTLPTGSFSEIEVIAAAQGDDLSRDFSVASLGRFHAGSSDFGYMVGSFHRDHVVGAFLTTDVAGTGWRVEAAYTESGMKSEYTRLPENFWRASLGADRQLRPGLIVSAEVYWNGFGADRVEDYATVAAADRVRRGEVTSLGKEYSGVSLAWQVHPLVTLTGAVLTNWGDGSSLLQPGLSWSTSDETSVLFGLILGVGPGDPGELGRGGAGDTPLLESEYGFVPLTVWGAFKFYW